MRHNGHMGERYVTASELKSFAFCRRAWLLERQGIESALVGEQARAGVGVKVAIDAWTAAAGITAGPVFRPMNRGDQAQETA